MKMTTLIKMKNDEKKFEKVICHLSVIKSSCLGSDNFSM